MIKWYKIAVMLIAVSGISLAGTWIGNLLGNWIAEGLVV